MRVGCNLFPDSKGWEASRIKYSCVGETFRKIPEFRNSIRNDLKAKPICSDGTLSDRTLAHGKRCQTLPWSWWTELTWVDHPISCSSSEFSTIQNTSLLKNAKHCLPYFFETFTQPPFQLSAFQRPRHHPRLGFESPQSCRKVRLSPSPTCDAGEADQPKAILGWTCLRQWYLSLTCWRHVEDGVSVVSWISESIPKIPKISQGYPNDIHQNPFKNTSGPRGHPGTRAPAPHGHDCLSRRRKGDGMAQPTICLRIDLKKPYILHWFYTFAFHVFPRFYTFFHVSNISFVFRWWFPHRVLSPILIFIWDFLPNNHPAIGDPPWKPHEECPQNVPAFREIPIGPGSAHGSVGSSVVWPRNQRINESMVN